MTIRINLDSVRKYRNTKEWRPVNRATATFRGKTYERTGDGYNIRLLCRDLLGDFPQISEQVEVWRGDTPCFAEMPIKSWAEGKALKGRQPEQFRKSSAAR